MYQTTFKTIRKVSIVVFGERFQIEKLSTDRIKKDKNESTSVTVKPIHSQNFEKNIRKYVKIKIEKTLCFLKNIT